MKSGRLPAILMVALLGAVAVVLFCWPAKVGASDAYMPDAEGMEVTSKRGLTIDLPTASGDGERRFTVDVLVISNPRKQNFIINVCVADDCTDPEETVVASFSFFPAPEAGACQQFTFSLAPTALSAIPAPLHFSIEELGDEADADTVVVNISDFVEDQGTNVSSADGRAGACRG